MNKLFLFGFVSLIFIKCLNAQVKIGSPGIPNTNAVLELDGGTSKGLLLPKLTNTEMIALNTAPDGLVVYNKTDNYLYLRKSAAWQKVSDATNGVGGLTLPYAGTASTLGGAEFSITHTTTFGDAAYFNNTAGGNAITSGSGNNQFNIVGGNTGIGIPAGLFDSPKLGKLVVRGTVGAVSAMFGDNTSGVSVMNNFPSIGFNYYFNAGSKAISPGFGAALGQDPSNGRIYFSSSAASVTGAGTAMPLVDRLVILANGNVGIGTPAPSFPLDVNGRLRIRSNGAFNTAGIYYDKIYTAGQSSFVGTFNDSIFGIYGGGNWKFFFDHINNNLGINNSDPKAPLSFSSAVGNKIDFYYNSAVSRYGFGLQGSLLQMYSDGAGSDIAFGYGSSTSFTEKMRIKGNGNVGIGINAPVNKLSVSDNSATDAVNFFNAGTGSALYALSSGGSAINAFAFNQNNPAIKVQGGSVSITTDGKVEIGGDIKISGGNPQVGQVLTATSVTGEATWKAAAYGNTERFQFKLALTSNVGSLTTVYNTGSAQASSFNDVISVNISKIGLYHFDVNASTYVLNNVPLSGRVASLIISQTATSFNTITHSPFYSAGNATRASIDKSFDIYINNPGIINFSYYDGIFVGTLAISVTGHLISD